MFVCGCVLCSYQDQEGVVVVPFTLYMGECLVQECPVQDS